MRKTPSKWREFQFAFHQTISAITPKLPLNSVLHNWKTKSPHPSQSQAERDDHNSNRYLSAYGGPPPPIENPKIFETQQLGRDQLSKILISDDLKCKIPGISELPEYPPRIEGKDPGLGTRPRSCVSLLKLYRACQGIAVEKGAVGQFETHDRTFRNETLHVDPAPLRCSLNRSRTGAPHGCANPTHCLHRLARPRLEA